MNLNPFLFNQQLEVILKLEADGKEAEIFSGNIEEFTLRLYSYGYEVKVIFTAFEDEIIPELFGSTKELHATLTMKSRHPKKVGATLFEYKGIRKGPKGYKPVGPTDKKVAVRLYEVTFVDPANKSWGSHFTKKIYVDQTMKDVIEAEKNSLITLQYDWDALNTAHPILAYSLEKPISFYSFLMWHLHQENGVFEYDYSAKTYAIRGKKKADGEPLHLAEWCITPAFCDYPEIPSYFDRVIKHSAENQDVNDIENPDQLPSVRKDHFDDSNYTLFPEHVSQTVKSKLYPENPKIQFNFKEIPDDFDFDQIHPGTLFEIKGDKTQGGNWCEDEPYTQSFRITEVYIQASRLTGAEKPQRDVQPFSLDIQVEAEFKDETFVPRPEFQTPTYPFFIQGKIVSKIGSEEQTTFNLNKSEKIPLGHYNVQVPLAGEDKHVITPFNPDQMSGQFYFPHCKDQQVMLAVYFQTAKIDRVLDLQPLTRAPLEDQLCQTVYASNGQHEYVKETHQYKDGKESTYTLEQRSSETQTQVIQIQDKKITMTVEDEGKCSIAIQMDRASGLTVMLKDEESGMTQTSTYTKESINHTSEKDGEKSSIIQTPKSILLDCETLNLKCKDMVVEGENSLTLNAVSKLFLKAPLVNILEKIKMGG